MKKKRRCVKVSYDFDKETLNDNMLLKRELESLKRYNRRWRICNIFLIIVLFFMIWVLIFLVI